MKGKITTEGLGRTEPFLSRSASMAWSMELSQDLSKGGGITRFLQLRIRIGFLDLSEFRNVEKKRNTLPATIDFYLLCLVLQHS